MNGERWRIRSQWPPNGWYDILDFGEQGRDGLGVVVATAFSRGRAELVRDLMADAWPDKPIEAAA